MIDMTERISEITAIGAAKAIVKSHHAPSVNETQLSAIATKNNARIIIKITVNHIEILPNLLFGRKLMFIPSF